MQFVHFVRVYEFEYVRRVCEERLSVSVCGGELGAASRVCMHGVHSASHASGRVHLVRTEEVAHFVDEREHWQLLECERGA